MILCLRKIGLRSLPLFLCRSWKIESKGSIPWNKKWSHTMFGASHPAKSRKSSAARKSMPKAPSTILPASSSKHPPANRNALQGIPSPDIINRPTRRDANSLQVANEHDSSICHKTKQLANKPGYTHRNMLPIRYICICHISPAGHIKPAIHIKIARQATCYYKNSYFCSVPTAVATFYIISV